jgi:gas vesicle protein
MANDSAVYFVTGLAAGIALGILFAPNSGEETRDLIVRKAGEGKDALKEQGLRLKKQAKEMGNRAADIVDDSREALNDEKDRLEYAVDSGVSAYKSGPPFSSKRRT